MSTYRYIFADLLTNITLAELPMSGVSFERILSGVGNFQGSIAVPMTDIPTTIVLQATIPGRTAVYIERSSDDSGDPGALVWGGIIWSRTWQETAGNIQITGQTFESFAYATDIRTSIIYSVPMDQRNMLRDLFTRMQAYRNRNIGIQIPPAFGNHILRTSTFDDYEAWTFGTAIDNLAGYDQGFDYTIEVAYDSTGNPTKYLVTNDVLGVPKSNSQLVFDFPGNIKDLWIPENAAKGAVTVVGIGAGEGKSMLRTTESWNDLLVSGYPDLVQFYTNKDVSKIDTLASQVHKYAVQYKVPVSVPTFEVNPEQPPTFGSYGLGDFATFVLQSERFADVGGVGVYQARIIGWQVTPGESDSQESLKLVIAGEDDVS